MLRPTKLDFCERVVRCADRGVSSRCHVCENLLLFVDIILLGFLGEPCQSTVPRIRIVESDTVVGRDERERTAHGEQDPTVEVLKVQRCFLKLLYGERCGV